MLRFQVHLLYTTALLLTRLPLGTPYLSKNVVSWQAPPTPRRFSGRRTRLPGGGRTSLSPGGVFSTNSHLTDWVVENLETNENKITSSSSTKAGENDTLPTSGLVIGSVRILAAEGEIASQQADSNDDWQQPVIRLLVGRNGWGTGVHPTTRMCLEWVCQVVKGGEVLLDYGCGSGILSIAALHLGARRCVGVDVEAEALVTAERNLVLNGYGEERFELLHTREVLPFDDTISAGGVDLCVANILIGQLVRPSMVAAIVSNLKPGGLLCLSGIRPEQVSSLRSAYDTHVDWLDDQHAELSASDTEGSIESYGFDCGRWARLVGRKRLGSLDVNALSELAVS